MRKKWLFKLKKGDNLEILPVYCAIHREILVSKNFSSALNEVLKSIVKCISVLKFNVKCKKKIKKFFKDKNGDHVTLLFFSR